MYVEHTLGLTHMAVMEMLRGAIAKADEIGRPQCIAIVDAGGVVLGQLRMSGAKFLSLKSAMTKARTAASLGAETGTIPRDVGLFISAATGGEVTCLVGGLPIVFSNRVLGGVGVGSGSPEEDRLVALAALERDA
ncbi:MAG: heme-binding protein [Pseudomonadota bacterium]